MANRLCVLMPGFHFYRGRTTVNRREAMSLLGTSAAGVFAFGGFAAAAEEHKEHDSKVQACARACADCLLEGGKAYRHPGLFMRGVALDRRNPFQALVSKGLCDGTPETEVYLMGEAERFVFEPTFNRAVKVQSRDLRLTSDAGFLLLREADQRLGLTASLVEKLRDPRHPDMIRYKILELLRERVYALAQGYRPTDDLDILAHDPALRLAAWDRPGVRTLLERLASQPTQSRLTDTLANFPENREILRKALGSWVGRHVLASAGGTALQRATLDV